MKAHQFHPSIIREYDMRGIFAETFSVEDTYAIGRTYASMAADHFGRDVTLAVGRDGRLSSPELTDALIRGMQDAGARVLNIGVGPTPMLYFSVYHLQADGGIMLTGSHNPKTHNGTKFMLGHGPFYGAQIRELGERAANADWREGAGSVEQIDVRDAYVARLLEASAPLGGLKLAWDAGNGAAGDICERLGKALPKCEHLMLYTDIDGNFPNHHPDPSVPENVAKLAQTVREQGCALGLAFDGDGDRLGAVDDKGRLISPDHLLMLFARGVLKDHAGATIIADVKTSQMLFDDVRALGGEPLMWMTGHSHIKKKLKETGAAFAGEASGHIFFADRYEGYDDGLYAALRLAELAAELDEPISALIDRLPSMHTTPEMRIDVEEARKFVIIDEIRARLDAAGADYLAIDGMRMNTADGWWLIRASNTQAAIIARAESATAEGLSNLSAILTQQLEASGVSCQALKA